MANLPPLSLYIHIPWCVRKCPYCDFNSHAAEGALPEQAYVAALLADLEQEAELVSGRDIETLFIGGGTPSLFSAESIRALLEGVAERLNVSPRAEITLEANPGTAEAGKFRGFREAGANRLSMGVQSFNDRHLRSLGRIHDAREAIAAAEIALQAGFENFNLDLMFGLPGQTREEALEDIRKAIALSPSHLSFYQLTLEPNTFFHKHPPKLPADEDIWDIQQSCQSLLADAGYRQYEVSAYARPGYRSRHNENYWRFGDYLGLGAGAHGKLTDASGSIVRYWKVRHPQRYMESSRSPARLGGWEPVERKDLPLEFMMNNLRLREGFRLAAFEERAGLPRGALEPGLSQCLDEGLLVERGENIQCSEKGWNFLDTVLEKFVA